MKKHFLRISAAALWALAAMFVSCDAGNTPDDGSEGGDVQNSRLVGKWNVGDNSLGIVSVEFGGSNNYVVVTDGESASRADIDGDGIDDGDNYFTYFGTYTIDGDKVVLSGFGTITVTLLKDGEITFSIIIDGETGKVTMSGGKALEMVSSTKTDLLCRTAWRIVSIEPEETEEDEDTGAPELVYFSKAGTYLVNYEKGPSMVSSWKWKSETDGTFYYSHEFPPVWDEFATATLETLTTDRLVVYEEWDDDDYSRTTLEAVR